MTAPERQELVSQSRLGVAAIATLGVSGLLALFGQIDMAIGAMLAGLVCVAAWRFAPRTEDAPAKSTAPAAQSQPGPVERPMPLAGLAPLLEGLPDPALLVDQDGRIVGSNRAARLQLRFEAEGLRLSSILRHPPVLDAAEAAAKDGVTRTVEYETAAQVEEHIRCYVAPVAWSGANAALMVFHDQTARINTERMRADFLANASHELRTPVAAISALIETLMGPARDDAEARARFLRMMEAQVDRMRRLISDLLSLSRIELDEHVPPTDRADLAQVAAEVVDSLAPIAQERGVTLVVQGLPRAVVVGERFQLAQVAQNLIDNAIKYSPKGGTVTVELGEAATREAAIERAGRAWSGSARISLLTPSPTAQTYAFLRVVDAGPGIPRRFLPRLGERFFRAEREIGEPKGGTGLGLAIVKHIVNRHRGGFVVESIPGQGSAFAVYLEQAGDNALAENAHTGAEAVRPLA